MDFEEGPGELRKLPDGSLVVAVRYGDRYSRASGTWIKDANADRRTETERDRGRLEYSSFIRRLAGVTQVVSPDLTAAAMHSRASHSHKVALVAREIADNIVRRALSDPNVAEVIESAGGLDVAACEAAGLAHDLGHPPFGHAGESALDKALRAPDADGSPRTEDGFEGNAQSFRIVAQLDRARPRLVSDGLDLTNVTLAAVLKYPFIRREPFDDKKNRKFGAYRVDEDALLRVRKAVLGSTPDNGQQTLEASIMDLADDIAYAIHDLEDFFAAGAIDARAVLTKLDEAIVGASDRDLFLGEIPDNETTWDFTRLIEVDDPFTKEANRLREKYETYFDDKAFGNALIAAKGLLGRMGDFTHPWDVLDLRTNLNGWVARFFAQVEVSAEPCYKNGPLVFLQPRAWHEIQALKVITSHFVVATPRMGMMQRAQSQTVVILVEKLAEWLLAMPKRHDLPVGLLRVMEAANVRLLDEEFTDTEANESESAIADGASGGDTTPDNAEVTAQATAKPTLRQEHYRAIADYICTMSDSEALLRAQWLSGTDHPALSVTSAWA